MIETSIIGKHLPDLYKGKINTSFTIPPNLNSAAVPPLPSFIPLKDKWFLLDSLIVHDNSKGFESMIAKYNKLIDL